MIAAMGTNRVIQSRHPCIASAPLPCGAPPAPPYPPHASGHREHQCAPAPAPRIPGLLCHPCAVATYCRHIARQHLRPPLDDGAARPQGDPEPVPEVGALGNQGAAASRRRNDRRPSRTLDSAAAMHAVLDHRIPRGVRRARRRGPRHTPREHPHSQGPEPPHTPSLPAGGTLPSAKSAPRIGHQSTWPRQRTRAKPAAATITAPSSRRPANELSATRGSHRGRSILREKGHSSIWGLGCGRSSTRWER